MQHAKYVSPSFCTSNYDFNSGVPIKITRDFFLHAKQAFHLPVFSNPAESAPKAMNVTVLSSERMLRRALPHMPWPVTTDGSKM